jgi:predicted XRE-type DNA-binding protein
MTDELVPTFASVWDAIEDTDEAAANMRLRSELMIAMRSAVAGWHMTQAQAAHRLGATQPRLNDLLRGRVARFSLDGPGGVGGSDGDCAGGCLTISRFARRNHLVASGVISLYQSLI